MAGPVTMKSSLKAGQAKTDSGSQSYAAPFAAVNYVREIETAPDGSRLTATERGVANLLAQHLNTELGIAWISVKKLAKEAGISARHCRRNLANLERKKVIQRVYMQRSDLGGQSTNDYFFPALGSPPKTPHASARRLEIQKVSRTPMTPKSGRRGQSRPRVADICVQAALTSTTGAPGHGYPPIESLGDCLIDLQCDSSSEVPAAHKRAATAQLTESGNTPLDKTTALLANSSLAWMAWDSVLEKLRFVHGANEVKKYRFRDVTVVSAIEDRAGIVHLTLHSPAPEKTKMGIAQHESVISQALRAFYGCMVKLQIIGHAQANDLAITGG